MTKLNYRFNRRSPGVVSQIVKRTAKQQLSGLTPNERSEILSHMLVTRNPGGSSLKVKITTPTALTSEFGTRSKPARPWVRKLQRKISGPIRSALAGLLTVKR